MELCMIKGILNREEYIIWLEGCLLHFEYTKHGMNKKYFDFMPDNAAMCTAKHFKFWLRDTNVIVLPWPTLSPDMTAIENIWDVLARLFYANGRQFSCVAQLIS